MSPSSSPDVLILQHVHPEPPGTIADALDDGGLPHRTVKLYRDEPVPDTLEADALVVMGGPMGVADVDDRPYLSQEIDVIEQALPDGATRLAHTTQTEHQAFRYGDAAYGLLFHLDVTPKPVAWMTKACQDEAAIRRAAMQHEEALRDTVGTVFGRWAHLVGEWSTSVTRTPSASSTPCPILTRTSRSPAASTTNSACG
jgi:GMP synthase-like glutamine amidotransferase